LLNELEWLDEELEEKPPATAKKKKKPVARMPARKNRVNPKKSGPTVKINFDGRKQPSQQAGRRSPAPTQPLLMLDKMKPPRAAKVWVKRLFDDLDSQAESPDDDAIAEAIHSFRRGLDGILKSGEELRLFPPRRRPVVIDMAGEAARARGETRSASPLEPEPAAAASAVATAKAFAEEEEAAEQPPSGADAERAARELQQYGLIPYRFNVFDAWLELSISFATPFAGGQYVLVATANQPGVHAVIREKEPSYAVVRLIRDVTSPHLEGELNWIALGEGTSPSSYRQ
jgi:hypothetical protein